MKIVNKKIKNKYLMIKDIIQHPHLYLDKEVKLTTIKAANAYAYKRTGLYTNYAKIISQLNIKII